MYSAIGVEPTKPIALMSGSSRMASTASLSPLTTLRMPGGPPASTNSSAEPHRHAGIALGRLEDEGVAAGDRRRELPQRDHRREVERRDAGDDAERLAHRIDVDAGAGAVGVLALHQVRRAERRIRRTSTPRWMSPLASAIVLPCSRARMSASSSLCCGDQFDELHQHAGAALRVGRGPGRLRRLGVLDRRAHLGLGGERDRPRTVPSIGWKTSPVRPDLPATCLPPMKCP